MTLPILYSKPGCQQCKATARWLDANGVEYDYRDASESAQFEGEVRALGYSQLPVVVTGRDHWYGFRPDRLDESFAKVAA